MSIHDLPNAAREAQAAVLSTVLHYGPEACADALWRTLDPEMFVDLDAGPGEATPAADRTIFDALASRTSDPHQENRAWDWTNIAGDLRAAGKAYAAARVAELANRNSIAPPSALDTHLDRLRDTAQRRARLADNAREREALRDPSVPAAVTLAGTQTRVDNLSRRFSGGTEDPAEAVPPPPAPFPLHCLPPVVRAMAEAVCAAVRVPADLAGPVALGILSGSIGAGLEVESGPDRRSRANLYLLVTAASGSGKSETLRWFQAAFLAYEQAAMEAHNADTLPEADAEADLLNVEIEKLKKLARADDLSAAGRQSIRASLKEKKAALAETEASKQAPVLTVDDLPTEKLALLLSRRGECLFSLSGEARKLLGNILGRYTKDGRTDEALYLAAWTGDRVRVDRIGRESNFLSRPCLAALWLVQPDKLNEMLAIPSLTEGGLLPRCLFNHSGAGPEELEDGPSPRVPADVEGAWTRLVRDLLTHWRDRQGDAALVRPTDAARALFHKHFNASVRRWKAGELRDVNAFRARWTEQGWRIALCLHAGRHGADAAGWSLTEETADAALTIADWFTAQQLAILARGRTDPRLSRLESLCSKLASHGGQATLRDLRKSHGFEEAEVKTLAADFPGRLGVDLRAPGPKGGRASLTAFLPDGARGAAKVNRA